MAEVYDTLCITSPYMTSEFDVFDMGADTYSGGHCGGSIRGGLLLTFFVDYQFRQML